MTVAHGTGVATGLSTECIVIYKQMISNFKDLHRLLPPCTVTALQPVASEHDEGPSLARREQSYDRHAR